MAYEKLKSPPKADSRRVGVLLNSLFYLKFDLDFDPNFDPHALGKPAIFMPYGTTLYRGIGGDSYYIMRLYFV